MAQSLELGLQPDSSRFTLPRFLEDIAERYGDRVAIRGEYSEITFRDLDESARRLAGGMLAAGVVKGARVAILMGNRPEWAIATFAASLVGAVVVPVNTFAKPDELDHILRHSDASVLLLQTSLLKHAFLTDLVTRHPELASGSPGSLRCRALPQLRRVVAFGLDPDENPGPGIERWEGWMRAGDDIPGEMLDEISKEIDPSDDALIIYTSGTTALPKGVLHLQRAPVIQAYRFAEDMALSPDDVVWSAYPFFWTAGIAMALGACLAAGAPLVIEEVFDPGTALRRIEAVKATTVQAWPHQEKAMAEHPSVGERDLSSVRKVEFANPLAKVVGLEKDDWGTYGSYGCSETFTICSSLPSWASAEQRSATSGKPLPGMTIRIVDPESGELLSQGEKGEIAVKGATFMRGYYKVEPELTVDENGFFRTQDGGHIDEQGFLHWSGRLSNLIKTGGANVSPLEIDAVACERDDVRVAMAVGIPHPTLGEAIILCVVPAAGQSPDADDLRGFLKGRLSAYKLPKRILFFTADELSYTGNQKIQLAPLRDAAQKRLEAEEAEVDGHVYRVS